MNKIRRRQFIVDKKIQFFYTGLLIWFLVIALIITGTALYSIIMNTVINTFTTAGTSNIYQIVLEINKLLALRIGILIIILIIIGIFLGIFYFHRIAGPIFRIEKTIKELINNENIEYTPIKLRNNDFFHSLAGNINKFMEKNKQKKIVILEKLDKLSQEYPDIKEKIEEIKKDL
jgi:methyl-accepting chemotaxis protein